MLPSALLIVIVVRLVQPLNVVDDNVVTLLGIVILVKLVQFLNALSSVDINVSGSVTLDRAEQFLKVLAFNVVIEPNDIISVRLVQP